MDDISAAKEMLVKRRSMSTNASCREDKKSWQGKIVRRRIFQCSSVNDDLYKSDDINAHETHLIKLNLLPNINNRYSNGVSKAPCTEGEINSCKDDLEFYLLWVNQLKKQRNDLELFGNLDNWLMNKPDKTVLEIKAFEELLRKLYELQKSNEILQNDGSDTSSETSEHEESYQLVRSLPDAIRLIERILLDRHLRLIDLFVTIDKKRCGIIIKRDIMQAVKMYHLPLTSDHVDQLMLCLDKNQLHYNDLALALRRWKKTKIENKKQRKEEQVFSIAELIERSRQQHYQVTEQHFSESGLQKSSHSELRSRSLSGNEVQSPTHSGSGSELVGVDSYLKSNRSYKPDNTDGSIVHCNVSSIIENPMTSSRLGNPMASSQLGFPEMSVAVRSHCAPSTLSGLTGEAVNKFRQSTLCLYNDVIKMDDENKLGCAKPVVEKGLLYYGDKQQTDLIEEIRQLAHNRARVTRRNIKQRSAIYPPISVERFTSRLNKLSLLDGDTMRATILQSVDNNSDESVKTDTDYDGPAGSVTGSSRAGRHDTRASYDKYSNTSLVKTSRLSNLSTDSQLTASDANSVYHVGSDLRSRANSRLNKRRHTSPSTPLSILTLPTGSRTDVLFQRVSTTSRSRSGSRLGAYTPTDAWQINDSGYVQYGTIYK